MPVSQTATLVASTVTTLTFPNWGDGDCVVEIDSNPAPVFVTADGSTPTVGGANEYEVSTVGERLIIPLNPPAPAESALPTLTIKLISTGTPTVTVSGG